MYMYIYAYIGPWNGQGDAPALASCTKGKRLEFDNVKEHAKVVCIYVQYMYMYIHICICIYAYTCI
jgi:hypothetical protein